MFLCITIPLVYNVFHRENCKFPIFKSIRQKTVYSHIMGHNRRSLARQVDADFFAVKPEPPQSHQPEDESAKQLMEMIQKTPDVAKLLLQMAQVLGNKPAAG